MMKLHLLLIIIFLFGFPVCSEAVQVRAFADRTVIAAGESVQLTVAVSNGDGTVDISGIQDFKVMSRGSGTSIQIVNGQMSKEVKYQYALIPVKEGSLVIPPLPVYSDGNLYHTEEIIITVARKPASDSDASVVFVEGIVSKTDPYEGEHFVYSFRLYNAVQIANARFQKPEFSGFVAKEIDDRKSYRNVVSGREFNVTEVNFLLIPMKTGDQVIEPAVLECDLVRRRSSSRTSPFDSFLNDPFFGRADFEHRIFRTEPVSVTVKPLPPYTGPGKFSGLVGKFNLKTEIDNHRLKVGDSSTFSVVIEGAGNITDADEPEVKVPDAFKVYKDSPQEDIRVGADGYSGKKVYKAALVALKEGDYTIEPVSFSYFDTRKGDYAVQLTQPLTVSILPADQKDVLEVFSSPSSLPPSLRKQVEFTGRDILPLKDDLICLKNSPAWSLNRFMFLIAAPVILFFAAGFLLALFRKTDDPAILMAQRAEKALQDAGAAPGELFFSFLYRALVSQILSNAGMKGESLTYSEAEQILQRKGYDEEIVDRAVRLLEKIDSAKFSGKEIGNDDKETLLGETRRVMAMIFRADSFIPQSLREKVGAKAKRFSNIFSPPS